MNEELLIRLVNAHESIAKSLVSLAEETRADKDLKNKLYEATTQMERNVAEMQERRIY